MIMDLNEVYFSKKNQQIVIKNTDFLYVFISAKSVQEQGNEKQKSEVDKTEIAFAIDKEERIS